MRGVVGVCLVLGLLQGSVLGGNCVCRLVPLYPVPGGWMHYANSCQTSPTGCTNNTPVAFIADPKTGESCVTPNSCFGCTTLAEGECPETVPSLYFESPRPKATEVMTVESFTKFIEANTPAGSGGAAGPGYGGLSKVQIRHPYNDNDKPVLVRFDRPLADGKSEPVYVILWKVEAIDNAALYSRIGVEVDVKDDMGVVNLKDFSVQVGYDPCESQLVCKGENGELVHRPIKGMVRVRLTADPQQPYFAYLRLQKEADASAQWKACPLK